ncbi:MAG: ABC transporter ATP-binding protein [Roseinatronobacter sp.]
MTLALDLEHVTKSFAGPDGDLPVLRGVSMLLGAAETLALTGESGSGKSTLLHICAGLDPAGGGRVCVAGADLSALSEAALAQFRRDRIGLVFQQFNLVPSLTVAANLALQSRLAGRHDPAFQRDLAARLGLSDLLTRYPEQLSGGQQQRVAIGRALAVRPALVLADEPTGNLDEATADGVLDLMMELCAANGAALMVVTHSARIAARMGREVRLRAGRVEGVR